MDATKGTTARENGSRAGEIVARALQDFRDEERRHHGPREPCEFGRGAIEALDGVLRLIEEDRLEPGGSDVRAGEGNYEGETYVFKARLGREPGQVIATGPDGRICFFDRHAALTAEIKPRQMVAGRIVLVGERHMIVQPIQVTGEYEVPDDGMPESIPKSELTVPVA